MQHVPKGTTEGAARFAAVWPRYAAAVLFAVLAVLIAGTFRDYGISWDEYIQDTYGEMLLAFYASDFADKSALQYYNLYLYGGFFDMVAAGADSVSPFGEFETRHLIGAILFLIGLAGGFSLARLLGGDRAAFLAVLLMVITPALYGHAFINPKDSPLAWLWTWAGYFACRLLGDRPRMIDTIGFGVCWGLALGTRALAGAIPVYAAAVVIAVALLEWRRGGGLNEVIRRAWRRSVPFLLATPLALALMAVFWPWSVQQAGGLLDFVQALQEFRTKFGDPTLLWKGEVMSQRTVPAEYLATLLVYKLPEIVLAGLAAGAVLLVAAVRSSGFTGLENARGRQLCYLVLWAMVPLILFPIFRPIAYNGIRHFLFILPPLCILAALAIDHVLALLAARGRAVAVAAAAVIAAAVMMQVAVLVRLHPYQYVAYNSLTGGLAGAAGRFDLDYWGTSLGEATRELASLAGSSRKRVFVCGHRMSAAYYLPPSMETTPHLDEADYFISIVGPPCQADWVPKGPNLVEVKRDGVMLSYVRELVPPPSSSVRK